MKNISDWLASSDDHRSDFMRADQRWSRATDGSWFWASLDRAADPARLYRTGRHPGHFLVTAKRVLGVLVFDKHGERVGRICDLSIDKASGTIAHVIMARGGFFGWGQRHYPLPWPLLTYSLELTGYVLSLDKSEVEIAPSLSRGQLEWCGGGEY